MKLVRDFLSLVNVLEAPLLDTSICTNDRCKNRLHFVCIRRVIKP